VSKAQHQSTGLSISPYPGLSSRAAYQGVWGPSERYLVTKVLRALAEQYARVITVMFRKSEFSQVQGTEMEGTG
jgi:hypothetical protein